MKKSTQECIDILFTKKGKAWLGSLELSQKELDSTIKILKDEDNSGSYSEGLYFNCGGAEVETMGRNTAAKALAGTILLAVFSNHRASLFIATFQKKQVAARAAFERIGYEFAGGEAKNPNTRNLICAAVLTLPPNYFTGRGWVAIADFEEDNNRKHSNKGYSW